jgi:hypothetical protein
MHFFTQFLAPTGTGTGTRYLEREGTKAVFLNGIHVGITSFIPVPLALYYYGKKKIK